MDKLLTDHGDPEKRIADLEHRLAERTGRAEPLPASPPDAAPARRFVASAAPPSTKQMMKYTYLIMFGAMASLGLIYMALFLVGALVGAENVMKVGGFLVFMAFLVLAMPAFGLFQRRMNRKKTVLLDVGSGGLTVSSRPGEFFSFGDAQLGKWTLAGYGGTAKGTALHLRSGRQSFVIGGQDHRLGAETPLDAPPVDSVDATMWASEFDELLDTIGRPRGLDAREPVPGQPTRCLLTPNPARMFSSSFFGMFKNTATAMRLNSNPPQPSLAIDVADDAISVIDVNSNARIASASLAQVTAAPAASTRSAPYVGTLTTAVLIVRVGNSQPLTIGCPDVAGPPQASWSGGRTKYSYRFAWRGGVPAADEPEFVVSDADWLTLVEKFGLASQLEDRARSDAAPAPTGAPLARPKRKFWIYGVIIAVMMFVVAPAMMFVASGIWKTHLDKEDQIKADRERQYALPFTGLRAPHGVAVDAAGNVYVSDTHTNRVLKLAAGSSAQTVLPFTGLDLCSNTIDASLGGVAVDSAGTVYVSDSCHSRVLKLPAGSSTQTVLPLRRLRDPHGLAVDAAGAVYVVNISDSEVLKLAPGSSTPTVLPSGGRGGSPNGDVAVDNAGNVYISVSRSVGRHSVERYLVRLAPGSDTWTRMPPAPDNSYKGLSTGEQDAAIDNAGNVYIFTGLAGGVMKLAPGSSTWTELPGSPRFVDPLGLAVDPGGKYVYVTDHTGSRATGSGLPWEHDDAQGFVLKLPAG
jgi:DNA-binding beta-propeller fold protein YncE